jgi:hypothetical protein
MMMRLVVAELLNADRQTDMIQLIVAFHNFGKVSQKKWWQHFKLPQGRPASLTDPV